MTAGDKPSSAPDPKKQVSSLGDIVAGYQVKEDRGYITQEFQDFGYRLALQLNDLKHKSLYIKMAKEVDRGILERALSFVSDADHAESKPRLFMWKVKQLKDERAAKMTAETPEEEQPPLF